MGLTLKENRAKMREILEPICENRYFDPPEGTKLRYPAIIYHFDNVNDRYADDTKYIEGIFYSVMLIDRDTESDLFSKLNDLPYSRLSRFFNEDGLAHYQFLIYVK